MPWLLPIGGVLTNLARPGVRMACDKRGDRLAGRRMPDRGHTLGSGSNSYSPSQMNSQLKCLADLRSSRITVSVVREDPIAQHELETPASVCRFWSEVVAAQPDHETDKENLVVVLVDIRLRPYAWNRVSLGSLTEATAHPREIFRPVIAGGAHGFVMIHNHPSGDPAPSTADRSVTRRIGEAATLLQINFLDHLIIGDPGRGTEGCFSFRAHGLL